MPNDANQNVWSTVLVNSVSYPVGLVGLWVGRPGLDPGTLGLKVTGELSTGCHRFQTISSCQVRFPASWTEWPSVPPFQ